MPLTATITVERTSQYGVLHQNRWFNFEPASGLSPESMARGQTYHITYNDKNGKARITSFVPADSGAPANGSNTVPMKAQPATPTPAIGITASGSGATTRDNKIVIQSIIKAVFGGPAFGHACVGRSDSEILALGMSWCDDLFNYVGTK